MRRSALIAASVLLGIAASAVPRRAAAQAPLDPATKVDPDSPASGFAPTAYAESMHDFEIDMREFDAVQKQLTSLAAQNASSPQVQMFAKRVREEFAGGRSSLRGKSDDQGVPIVGTAKLRPEHQTLVSQLQASGGAFDRVFVDYEVLILKEALGVVQPYATGGTDGRFRQAAAEAVSAEQVLLTEARSLQSP